MKKTDTPDSPEQRDSPFLLVARAVRDDSLLWPIAAVAWLILSTFGAFVLFYAVRVRSMAAGIALLFVIFFTIYGFDRDIRARRLSAQNALVLSLWAGSALGAFALERLGA